MPRAQPTHNQRAPIPRLVHRFGGRMTCGNRRPPLRPEIEWLFDETAGVIHHDTDECELCRHWVGHYDDYHRSNIESFKEATSARDRWFHDAGSAGLQDAERASMSREIEEVRQELASKCADLEEARRERDQERSACADFCAQLEEVRQERDEERSACADSRQEVDWVRTQWDAECDQVSALRRELEETRKERDEDRRRLAGTHRELKEARELERHRIADLHRELEEARREVTYYQRQYTQHVHTSSPRRRSEDASTPPVVALSPSPEICVISP